MATSKKRGKRAVASRKTARGTKKPRRGRQAGINKSALVREFRSANPGSSVAQIRDHLSRQGVSISTAGIYQALRNAESTGRKGAKRRSRPQRATSQISPSRDGLVGATIEFIRQAGGLGQARELLQIVE